MLWYFQTLLFLIRAVIRIPRPPEIFQNRSACLQAVSLLRHVSQTALHNPTDLQDFRYLVYYVPPAGRVGDYQMPLVCECLGVCMCQCQAVFSKVKSCWVFSLNNFSSVSYVPPFFCCFCRCGSVANGVIRIVATLSKLFYNSKTTAFIVI